jgi:hypothetical protein
MVVAAPPGSALDAGGELRGGVIGGLLGILPVIFRSGRRGWRIAVTPCDGQGRPKGRAHRERVSDQGAAESRAEVILADIRHGRWPPNSGATDQR